MSRASSDCGYLGEGTIEKSFSFSLHAGYSPAQPVLGLVHNPTDWLDDYTKETGSIESGGGDWLVPDNGRMAWNDDDDVGTDDVLRWTPSVEYPADTLYFDVIRHNPDNLSGHTGPYIVLHDQAMTNDITSTAIEGGTGAAKCSNWNHLWVGSFDLDNSVLAAAVEDSWKAGEMYTIVVKELPTSQLTAEYLAAYVTQIENPRDPGDTIGGGYELIGMWDSTSVVRTMSGNAGAGNPDSLAHGLNLPTVDHARSKQFQFKIEHDIHRKLEWIRNDIENVVFPRTKRLLALQGENLLLDKFTYDTAGNITGLRMRLFEDSGNAQSATADIDDSSLPEPGEMVDESTSETARYYKVEQTNELPRNIRTSHISYASTDFEDATTTENIDSAQTGPVQPAPGNTEADAEDLIWGDQS